MTNYQLAFVLFATVLSAFLGIIWTRKTWLNVALKGLLFIVVIWGLTILTNNPIIVTR